MVNAPKFKAYGNFSGPMVQGLVQYSPLHVVTHQERAFFITSLVECNGMFGSIVMYDGTCVTAGLHQSVLVYPQALATENFTAADDQGELPKMLAMFDAIPYFNEKDDLWGELAQNGWIVKDGIMKYSKNKDVLLPKRTVKCLTGDTVFGADLRNTMCPIAGKVPASGPNWVKACDWAQMFSAVFSDYRTFDMQIKFGIDHNIAAANARKVGNTTVAQFMYNGDMKVSYPFKDVPELDLAMVMYFSHAVNAPAIANKCLNQAVAMTGFPGLTTATKDQQLTLAKHLVKLMGTSDYGKWDDNIPNGRYQRTRDCMIKSKFWGAQIMNNVMPKVF